MDLQRRLRSAGQQLPQRQQRATGRPLGHRPRVRRAALRRAHGAQFGRLCRRGWWWYYGLTATQVSSYLSSNSARLIESEPYDAGGGTIRFAVVMISNTGTQARNWTWLYGATSSSIGTHVGSTRWLIDIDSYVVGGVKRYTTITVLNSGADAKSWQWWVNQTPSAIAYFIQ